MFRNMNSDERFPCGGQSSPPAAGPRGAPVGLDGQERSWIGLLSRPVSLVQKLLPGWLRNPALPDPGPEFLRQLEDMMPLAATHAGPHLAGPHLAYLRCQQVEPEAGWLGAEALRDLGLHREVDPDPDPGLCQQAQLGYLGSVRTLLNQVLLSPLEPRAPPRGKHWVPETVRWGGLLAGEDRPEPLCRAWTAGEQAGASPHREEPPDKGGAKSDQNREHLLLPSPADQDHGYSSLEEEQAQRSQPGEEADTPMEEEEEQLLDEEEQLQEAQLLEEEEQLLEEEQEVQFEEEEEAQGEVQPRCQNRAIAFIMGCPCSDDEEEEEEEDSWASGSSCSSSDGGFDSDSDSEGETSDSEPDSEEERLWSSLCRSGDPYNPRNFTARLHTKAPQSGPPVAPSSQSSPLPTQSSPPVAPTSQSSPLLNQSSPPVAPSSQSSPPLAPTSQSSPPVAPTSQSSPPVAPTSQSSPPVAHSSQSSPLLTQSSPPVAPRPSSPPSALDWGEDGAPSDLDERLLSSFSCSDPYSLLNFQAPLRTRGSACSPPRTQVGPRGGAQPGPAPQNPGPDSRRRQADERQDSGFSEPHAAPPAPSSRSSKKVRFCEDVEEFFASGGEEEDRRGPWEQLARDRCRFQRRCREVEQSIGYCLQPQHRQRVYGRLGGGGQEV